jgi:geranylgeranyl reductase family protein
VEESYDVVVAGLGPAGAVALWHLARLGMKVLGVDQRDWGSLWGKPCGDAIGAHHPREAHLPELPSRVIRNRVSGIDIFSPSENVRYRILGEGYIIDRGEMGRWLIKEAMDRGAEVLLKTNILAPIIENGKVAGVLLKGGEGKVHVRAKVVVEATGFSRVIRLRLPKEWPVYEDIEPTDYEVAYREVIEYEDFTIEEPSIIRIYLNQDVAPGGYWWFFPESSMAANVGLGVQNGKGYPNPLRLYREKLAKHALLSRRYIVKRGAGAPLPTRHPSNSMVGPGIVVIGDAGYTVNPLHGGGMGYSFRAAYFAAKAIEEAFERGDFTPKGLWSLNVNYMKTVGARQAALDVFRRFLQMLSNEDIEYGMKNKLIPEQDVYYTSSSGDIRLSIVEKAMILLRGLGRPSLLSKLKLVADYMKKIKNHYESYPEQPEQLPRWIAAAQNLYNEYLASLESKR